MKESGRRIRSSAQELEGRRVIQARKKKNWSQEKLATRLGVTPAQVGHWERGRERIPDPRIEKIEKELGLATGAIRQLYDAVLMERIRNLIGSRRREGGDLDEPTALAFVGSFPAFARMLLHFQESYEIVKNERDALQESRSDRSGVAQSDDTDDPNDEAPDYRKAANDVTSFFQGRDNYFGELDDAAERVWAERSLVSHDLYHQLQQILRDDHDVSLRFKPSHDEPEKLRHFDSERRELVVSEALPPSSRLFELSVVLGQLTVTPIIRRILDSDDAPRGRMVDDLLARALYSYFAAALIMPYEAFVSAAEDYRYDVELLGSRFGVSFEQACQRLSSMRRRSREGVRFHFLRIDIAGNVSKRFSASGMPLPVVSGICPLWVVHEAFSTPNEIRTQVSHVALDDDSPDRAYFCFARTVTKPIAGFRSRPARFVVCLGCSLDDAQRLIYFEGANKLSPTLVGIECQRCPRGSCSQRAFPRLYAEPALGGSTRHATPFWYADDQ